MRRRLLGCAVWAAAWACALAAILIPLLWELPSQPLPGLVLSRASAEIRGIFPVIGIRVALVYGPVAALILFRRANAVGAILAVHAVGSGLGALGAQWGLLGAQSPGLPLWGLLAFASGWSYIPGTFMTAVLPLLVTRARIPRWQRALVALGAVNAAAATLAGLVQQSVPVPRNPLAIADPRLQALLPEIYLHASFLAVLLACATGAVLVTRWVRARGRGRTGLAWLTLGHVFLACGYAVLVLPAPHPLPGLLAEYGLLAPVLGQVIYPAAILVVVLGQGLWGQRVVLSRIILWALLTISGVGLYLAIVLTAPRALPSAGGAQIVVPLLIALAIQPLRRWIQSRIDHLVYGEGSDPATLLARLGARIGALESGTAGLGELCDALRRELRLASVEIVLHGEEPGAVPEGSGPTGSVGATAQLLSGEPTGAAVRIPIARDPGRPNDLLAELVVSAPGGQRLDRRSLRVLRDLSGLVAAAIHLAEANRRLDLARDGLFAERAEERRTIQRELHDGLGPALAGIGFGLAAAANVLREPERADALLAELERDLAKHARAVRRLAGEVSPSPLGGASLDAALEELAARFRTDRFAVDLDVEPESLRCGGAVAAPLAQDAQDALFLIAAEALTNAARHSGAERVRIRVRAESDRVADAEAIVLRVSDDGSGLPRAYRPGIGLASIRQRAESLGGELRLLSAADGLEVVARIPTARDAARSATRVPAAAGHLPVSACSSDATE